MKKFISLVLCVVLVFALMVPTFAVGTVEEYDSAVIDEPSAASMAATGYMIESADIYSSAGAWLGLVAMKGETVTVYSNRTQFSHWGTTWYRQITSEMGYTGYVIESRVVW